MPRQRAKGGLNFKRWFKVHVWSALATFVLIAFLAVTGVFIYPLDQFRLRDVHIQSALLPPRYEVNTWGEHVKSIAITDKAWFATHRQGVFRSLDRGQTWQDVTGDIPGDFVAGEGLYPPVLAANPSDTQMLMVSKGRGIALSMNGGEDWTPYGESYDEDLSDSGIVQLIFVTGGVAVAIDDNGFVYQRFMHPDEDEGWELTSLAPPLGEAQGVGKLDWMTVALHLHNGQVFLENDWWWVNHAFALLLVLLAYTGVTLWWHRRQKRRYAVNAPRPASHWYFRHLHRIGGLLSWPLLYLLPLSGILLLHIVDFSVFAYHGPPAAWFPAQFDTNRWKGPVYLNLRTLSISRSNPAHIWAGHTYGLFATEDGGQTWERVGETLSAEVLKHVDPPARRPRLAELPLRRQRTRPAGEPQLRRPVGLSSGTAYRRAVRRPPGDARGFRQYPVVAADDQPGRPRAAAVGGQRPWHRRTARSTRCAPPPCTNCCTTPTAASCSESGSSTYWTSSPF